MYFGTARALRTNENKELVGTRESLLRADPLRGVVRGRLLAKAVQDTVDRRTDTPAYVTFVGTNTGLAANRRDAAMGVNAGYVQGGPAIGACGNKGDVRGLVRKRGATDREDYINASWNLNLKQLSHPCRLSPPGN